MRRREQPGPTSAEAPPSPWRQELPRKDGGQPSFVVILRPAGFPDQLLVNFRQTESPNALRPTLRDETQPWDRTAAFQGVQESAPAPAGIRARRGCRELRMRDSDRACRVRTACLALGTGRGANPCERPGKSLRRPAVLVACQPGPERRHPIGRKARKASLSRGTPLIGLKPKDIVKAGVTRIGRTVDAGSGRPVLEDGQTLDVSAVVWATGYRPDFSWIKLPICDENGYPRHDRGVAAGVTGLYFLGLPFQRSLSSSLIGGVGIDARFVTHAVLSADS